MRNRAFVPDLGPLPSDYSGEAHYVCTKYPDCRDKPVPESKMRPNQTRTCRTHGYALTTRLAPKEEEE
jgi:hypothetical protein